MKKACKVFLVLGMVFGFYLIFPIVLGACAFKRVNKAQKAEELKGWGIICIFFVSTLGGIFMLCLKDSDLADNVTNQTGSVSKVKDETALAAEKLLELRKLFDLGVIDKDVYEEKRKKYVEEL